MLHLQQQTHFDTKLTALSNHTAAV